MAQAEDVSRAENIWREKSDEDLAAAIAVLDEYSELGQKVILAERERRSQARRSGPPPPFEEPATVTVTCADCGTNLRFRLPLAETTYCCGRCETRYQCQRVASTPEVFLLVAVNASTHGNGDRGARTPNREQQAALDLLGLSLASTLEQARAAHRQLVKSYHPDKVAHLGPELRTLAESKTKQLNAAIATIEQFLQT